jgi:23S rRNA pseudouridine1911/1915/1917 synthase
MIVHFSVAVSVNKNRLDKFLASQLSNDFSRSKIQEIITAGKVHVNDKVVADVNYHLKYRDEVTVSCEHCVMSSERTPLIAESDVAFDVLYEDEDLLVVNKPAGLVVHPGAGNHQHTLVNGLMYHCGSAQLSSGSDAMRPGIVHRIDKDTSGVIVIAKNDRSHAALAEQFRVHSIKRRYICFCYGVPAQLNGKIDTFIARDRKNRLKMAVSDNVRSNITHNISDSTCCDANYKGKRAITFYRTLAVFSKFASKIECELHTGRTHQIRTHMAYIGNSLIGDSVYKAKNYAMPANIADYINKFPRQALHAYFLEFEHPTSKKIMHFETELPQDIKNLESTLFLH